MRTEPTDDLTPPAPQFTDWNSPYFEAAADGELRLQRCANCGKTVYYPRIACPGCLSTALSWESISGQGSIYSYSVVWRPKNAAFDPHLPIVMVAVELDDGPLLIADLVECDPDSIEIGMPVEACFSALDGGPVLPRFRPAGRGEGS